MQSKLLGHDADGECDMRIRTLDDLVTHSERSLGSPRGCVGRELRKVQVQNKKNLHVEVVRLPRNRRLMEAQHSASLRLHEEPVTLPE